MLSKPSGPTSKATKNEKNKNNFATVGLSHDLTRTKRDDSKKNSFTLVSCLFGVSRKNDETNNSMKINELKNRFCRTQKDFQRFRWRQISREIDAKKQKGFRLKTPFFSAQEFFGKTKFDRCSTDLAPRIDGTGRREDHLYNMQKNLEYRSRQMDKNKQETRKKAKKQIRNGPKKTW